MATHSYSQPTRKRKRSAASADADASAASTASARTRRVLPSWAERSLVACSRAGNLSAVQAIMAQSERIILNTGAQRCVEPVTSRVTHSATDWLGRSALHRAARYGRVDVVTFLLESGSDPLLVDVHGQSALHVAAQYEHEQVVRALMRQVKCSSLAALMQKDCRYGLSPGDYLRQQGYTRLASELDAAVRGAKPAELRRTFELRDHCIYFPRHTSAAADVVPSEPLAYTEQQHEIFASSGFHIFNTFLETASLRLASERVDDVLQSLHPKADPLRLYNLHQCGQEWITRLALHPAVTAVVSFHCGRNFFFYLSHVIAKAPKEDYVIPWHQDFRTKGDMRHCSIWISLDDARLENGAVHCIPGAHKAGQLPSQDLGHVDFGSAILPESLSNLSDVPNEPLVLQVPAGGGLDAAPYDAALLSRE